MSRTRVTIGRVVLNGIKPEQRQAVVDGLRGELAHMLADPTTRATVRSQHIPALRLRPIELAPGRAGGRRLGAGLARGIGRGLAR
jgi:hypothetical protein